MIHISPGNTKLGKIPNISLPPIITCGEDVACRKLCYAVKFFKMYPGVKTAWEENLSEYLKDPDNYFNEIGEYLKRRSVKYFRFHVSGDIPDKDYLFRIIKLAEKNKNTKIRLFTKRYDWASELSSKFPPNLNVALSAWPGVNLENKNNLPVAWLLDRSNIDERIPGDVFKCKDDCSKCKVCWNTKRDVVFHKH